MQFERIQVLANPVRLKLLCCLAHGPKHVLELVTTCELSQSAISQHLTKLKNAGLVVSDRKGRFIYYSPANEKTIKLARELELFCKEEVKG